MDGMDGEWIEMEPEGNDSGLTGVNSDIWLDVKS
jgi:hypothetical protein